MLSTSFGVQSAVMLHLATRVKPDVKILWIDTGYLPPETYRFAAALTRRLGLNLTVEQSDITPARMEALHGKLWEQHHANVVVGGGGAAATSSGARLCVGARAERGAVRSPRAAARAATVVMRVCSAPARPRDGGQSLQSLTPRRPDSPQVRPPAQGRADAEGALEARRAVPALGRPRRPGAFSSPRVRCRCRGWFGSRTGVAGGVVAPFLTFACTPVLSSSTRARPVRVVVTHHSTEVTGATTPWRRDATKVNGATTTP